MGNALIEKTVLTDRLLRSWLRCKRKAWLDKNWDPNQRIWTAHRTLQLDGQQRSFLSLIPPKPGKGLEGCNAGALSVVGLRLKGTIDSGQSVEAHPPILQRKQGASKWGNFFYRPILGKQGRKLSVQSIRLKHLDCPLPNHRDRGQLLVKFNAEKSSD